MPLKAIFTLFKINSKLLSFEYLTRLCVINYTSDVKYITHCKEIVLNPPFTEKRAIPIYWNSLFQYIGIGVKL